MSSTAVATGRHRLDATPAPVVVRRSPGRRLLGVVGKVLGNLLVLVCLAVFLLIAVGPHVLGYRTATMLTGSMDPGITPGDVVVTVPEPASEVEVGDVVSYQIPVEDHRVETHRVVKVIHQADGAIAIQTQGDANEARDPWTATIQGDTVWQMKAVVPQLGNVIHVLRAPAVQHAGFWGALAGLILLGLSSIWRKPSPDGSSTKQAA